jgi:hypothetical protein
MAGVLGDKSITGLTAELAALAQRWRRTSWLTYIRFMRR